MARPNRASQGSRRRWDRVRRCNAVRDRILMTLRNTLCYRDLFRLQDDVFKDEVKIVSEMIEAAPEGAKEMVYAMLPLEGMTQDQVQVFKEWLKIDMGTPIRECLEWCRFMKRSFVRCSDCRKGAPLLIDSDSDDE